MKLRLGLILLAMGLFLVVGISKVEWSVASEAIGEVDWLLMSPIFLLYILTHVARSIRLGALLATPVPFWRLFSINAIGFMAINVIPLRLGEAVRPYLLKEQDDVDLGVSVAGIVVERLYDFAMLLTMLLIVGFAIDLPSHSVAFGGREVDVIAVGQRGASVMLSVAVVGLVVALGIGERFSALLERFGVIGRVLDSIFRGFLGAFKQLRQDPMRGVVALLCSLVVWGTTIAAVWLVMRSFGLSGGWAAALVCWTFTITGMTFMPTPGFFGAYEACCAGALVLMEICTLSEAMAFALVLHLGQFVYLSVLGVTFLVKEGVTLGGVVRSSLDGAKGQAPG